MRPVRFRRSTAPISLLGLSLLSLGAALAAPACGGANPTTPIVHTTTASATVTAPPPVMTADLSEVAAPDKLIASGRLMKPMTTLATVKAWTRIPFAPSAEMVAELLSGEPVGGILDLDQPVDFAVGLGGNGGMDMKLLWAVSVAVKNADDAKAAFGGHGKLTTMPGGALRIEASGGAPPKDGNEPDAEEDEDEGHEKRHCELGPAFGSASMRLVCGVSVASLDALSAYLRRTVTRKSHLSDLHVELTTGAVKPLLSAQKRMASRALGGLIANILPHGALDMALALGNDFVDFGLDLDTAGLDFRLGDAALDVSMAVKFGSAKSVLSRLAVAHPERTDVPPAAFWQLPQDSRMAWFHRGVDAAIVDGPRDILLDAVSRSLQGVGVKPKESVALVDAMRKLLSSAPLVYASGIDVASVKDKLVREKSARHGADASAALEAKRDAAEALIGWRLVGIEESPARLQSGVKELAAAWTGLVNGLPAHDRGDHPPTLRLMPLPRGAQLPRDTVHAELDFFPFDTSSHTSVAVPAPRAGGRRQPPAPPPRPAAQKAVRLHLLVAADAGRTWVALGASEQLLVSKLNAVMASAPESGKLASRSDLASLHTIRMGAGGFSSFGRETVDSISALAGEFYGMVERYEGMSPTASSAVVPYTMSAQAGNPGTFVATSSIPRASIEDMMRMLSGMAHSSASMPMPSPPPSP